MAFEYSCFISYPHGQDNVLVPIVQDFVEGLKIELGAQSRKRVWFDQILTGGQRVDEAISAGLCKSGCMIMFYTPLYFDEAHTYCARELMAMQDLEEDRKQFIADKSRGLIIPIILRGEQRFPAHLKQRLYYDFTQHLFNNRRVKIRQKYARQIQEIASYVLDQCASLDTAGSSLQHDCDNYRMPSVDVTKTFVQTVLERRIVEVADAFPGRSDLLTAEMRNS